MESLASSSPDFDCEVVISPFGGVTGKWDFNYSGKIITFVNLVMELQYRKNFLFAWEEVDSETFIYAGGQGSNESNQSYFMPTDAGQYRVKVSGTITNTTGSNYIIHYSGQKYFDGEYTVGG
ncbi:hypothetical protein K0T92_04525 [Paenibacillus oenotherae]|uniref:Uncharacterized protein n=1 Tax=Paenibacillus oenotherae TaxID=1435645 RepID=A0ABS7D345_9BACL|nr:hypothetical protein [Paenibacillus oenotherae]MBW7473997.1 hypothetical protein [Paenibacillus oenotherae]